jgi:hypothetical protein
MQPEDQNFTLFSYVNRLNREITPSWREQVRGAIQMKSRYKKQDVAREEQAAPKVQQRCAAFRQ